MTTTTTPDPTSPATRRAAAPPPFAKPARHYGREAYALAELLAAHPLRARWAAAHGAPADLDPLEVFDADALPDALPPEPGLDAAGYALPGPAAAGADGAALEEEAAAVFDALAAARLLERRAAQQARAAAHAGHPCPDFWLPAPSAQARMRAALERYAAGEPLARIARRTRLGARLVAAVARGLPRGGRFRDVEPVDPALRREALRARRAAASRRAAAARRAARAAAGGAGAPGALRAWRRAAGLTQAQAAGVCGVSARSWRRYEAGRAPTPPAVAARLAQPAPRLPRPARRPRAAAVPGAAGASGAEVAALRAELAAVRAELAAAGPLRAEAAAAEARAAAAAQAAAEASARAEAAEAAARETLIAAQKTLAGLGDVRVALRVGHQIDPRHPAFAALDALSAQAAALGLAPLPPPPTVDTTRLAAAIEAQRARWAAERDPLELAVGAFLETGSLPPGWRAPLESAAVAAGYDNVFAYAWDHTNDPALMHDVLRQIRHPAWRRVRKLLRGRRMVTAGLSMAEVAEAARALVRAAAAEKGVPVTLAALLEAQHVRRREAEEAEAARAQQAATAAEAAADEVAVTEALAFARELVAARRLRAEAAAAARVGGGGDVPTPPAPPAAPLS